MLGWDFDGMNCFDICNLVINDPDFVVCHFHICVEIFLQEKVLIPVSILGQVTYHDIRIAEVPISKF